MKEKKIGDVSVIKNQVKSHGGGPAFLSVQETEHVYHIHRGLPEYQPTPLVRLDAMAQRLGLKAFFVKDESQRFGLNAFKGLGGIYALTQLVGRELRVTPSELCFETLQKTEYRERIRKMVFVTATDGNHGKGISWAAGKLGCEVHIYMPAGSSELRAQAIRNVNEKAQVRIMETGYDDTVRFAAEMAKTHGWYLVQDTSWNGYEEIPTWIVQGYTTLAREACEQMEAEGLKPTHVFVQAGVGAMAGGIAGFIVNYYAGARPVITVVEPENIACIFQSAKVGDGKAHEASEQLPTIMAGLNCGEPCTITWPILRDFSDWYMKCPDYVSAYGMRLLAAPQGNDRKVISGESGAVTTGLVNLIAGKAGYGALKKDLGLTTDSVVVCINTEGDTDPGKYRRIVYEGEEAFPQTMQ